MYNPEIFIDVLRFVDVCFQFKPLEQLMGVFPAGSKQHVPPTWQDLMTDPVSIILLEVLGWPNG